MFQDIKPANIFINTDGNWYLGDFDTCVPLSSKIIGHTPAFILKDFVGQQGREEGGRERSLITIIITRKYI
jgi:serine/threonine protein kinase